MSTPEGSRAPELRASDADRDRVAELLRTHAADGRLTLEEFQARLDACLTSRTYGELDALLTDLPAVPTAAGAVAAGHVPEQRRSLLPPILAPFLLSNIICWVVWLATGTGYPWPIWVTGPWGAVLLVGLLTGQNHGRPAIGPPPLPPLPPGPGVPDHVARRIEHERAKAQARAARHADRAARRDRHHY